MLQHSEHKHKHKQRGIFQDQHADLFIWNSHVTLAGIYVKLSQRHYWTVYEVLRQTIDADIDL